MELRQISGKVRQLRAIQQHYAEIAPASLLRASCVMHTEQGILTLAANNGAVAAKLRQMSPDLLEQLNLRGCEVTGIQVKVQVTLPAQAHASASATISAEGKQQLNKLAESLQESPLKSALQRLARTRKDKAGADLPQPDLKDDTPAD